MPRDQYVSPTHQTIKPPGEAGKPWRQGKIPDERVHMAVHMRLNETLHHLALNSVDDIASTVHETHQECRTSADDHIDFWFAAASSPARQGWS
jgi:hypothetical protein